MGRLLDSQVTVARLLSVSARIPFKRSPPLGVLVPRVKKGAAVPDRNVNVGVPPALVRELDRFLQEYVQFGIRNRNDFVARAVAAHLATLRREAYEQAVMDAYKAGKPGPVAELQKSKAP